MRWRMGSHRGHGMESMLPYALRRNRNPVFSHRSQELEHALHGTACAHSGPSMIRTRQFAQVLQEGASSIETGFLLRASARWSDIYFLDSNETESITDPRIQGTFFSSQPAQRIRPNFLFPW